jgi:hypothetical protein
MGDAVFKVTLDDGRAFNVTADENSTPESLKKELEQQDLSSVPTAGEKSTLGALGKNVGTDVQGVESGGMDVLRGAGAVLGEPLKKGAKLLGIGASTQQPTGEGVTGGKVPAQPTDETTPGYLAGNLLAGAGAGGAAVKGAGLAAKALPKAAPLLESPMARAVGGGAMGGLMQPTPEGTDYWKTVGKDVGFGMAMGYGLSVGGKVASSGLSALGEYLQRNMPEVANNKAIGVILNRIQNANRYGAPSATDMLQITNEANAAGRPMAPIDVYGKGSGVKSLGGYLARQPETKDFIRSTLQQRGAGAMQRLEDAVTRHISSGQSSYRTIEGLQQARSEASRPLYEETDKLQGVWSPALEEFLKNPDIKKGLAAGYRLERLSSLGVRPFNPTQLGVDLDAEGNIVFLRKPNMRVLDMGKQGLDAMIAAERDPISGRLSRLGVELNGAKKRYVALLDSLDSTGVYAKARATWSGFKASEDAVKIGKTAFERSPEENAAEFAELSPSDQEFARVGLADNLREKLARAGFGSDDPLAMQNADVSRALFKNDWTKRQLQPYFKSSKDYDEFVQAVTDERTMQATKNELTAGSQTAERLGEDTANQSGFATSWPALYHTGKAILHSPFAVYHAASAAMDAYKMFKAVGIKPTPEMNEAMAKILFSPNSAEAGTAKLLLKAPPPMPPTRQAQAGRAIQDVVAPMAAAGAGAVQRDQENPLQD